jgi:hypothetical protein
MRAHVVAVEVAVAAWRIALARLFNRHTALAAHAVGQRTANQTVVNAADTTRPLAA